MPPSFKQDADAQIVAAGAGRGQDAVAENGMRCGFHFNAVKMRGAFPTHVMIIARLVERKVE